MFGIKSTDREVLNNIIEDLFDNIALQFIGDIPSLKNKKRLIISGHRNMGLSHLFVQSMKNKAPNELEKDFLKRMLENANGYIESLKERTKSNLSERIDGLVRQSQIQNRNVSESELQEVINEEMKKAKSHLIAIAESESTKLRNLGTMMDISRVASSIGDEDPTVFFVVVKDNATCKECIRLHLMPDKVTPRLWKFSELKQAYHKRGDDGPSVFGLHPHCRCTLTYLSRGFGFDKKGKIKYTGENYDAYQVQNLS